ncbi:MAG: chemotaxis protein CheA [Candidatus Poribacteria bacterium]|nr:chemotaxis protein CheA [Candidatus Poribacteria bacterium]
MSNEQLFDDPEMLESFLMEADEIVEKLDDDLVTLETQPDDLELLDAIFRSVHTLKGMSGFLGFTQLVQLAHETESVLDRVRKQELSVDPDLIDVILEAIDLIKVLLEDIRSQEIQTHDMSEISAKLEHLMTDSDAAPAVETSEEEEADAEAVASESSGAPLSPLQWLQQQGETSIGQAPEPVMESSPETSSSPDLSLSDMEVSAVTNVTVEEIAQALGITQEPTTESGAPQMDSQDETPIDFDAIFVTEIDAEELGNIDDIDTAGHESQERADDILQTTGATLPEASSSPDLSLSDMEVSAVTNVTVEEIAQALGITEEPATEPGAIQIDSQGETPINFDEISVTEMAAEEIGDIDDIEAGDAHEAQERATDIVQATKPTFGDGESDAKTGKSTQPAVQASKAKAAEFLQSAMAQGKPSAGGIRPETASTTIRVDVKRLEEMMNLIGELVLERNRLLKLNKDFEQKLNLATFEAELSENSERLNRLTTDLQQSILSIRMLPIGSVFKKFPRIVRDIARDLNKEVKLSLSGEDTELDKTIVDVISEPLVHLIRNSVDHGLETPEEREAAGKPRQGNVWLSASHAGNQIIIEIVDDGKGIDEKVIGAKAVEKGIVTPEQLAEMSHNDILDLIFIPGFSTATQVSKLSGRGVGMDVVRTTVRNFNGSIDLESQLGKGTHISLKLPLTLAIIQGLVVKVGKETFAIPLSSVIETVRIRAEDIQMMKQREVLDLRNQTLPLVRLREVLKCSPADEPERQNTDTSYVVVLGVAEQHVGVIVDSLIGEEEIVVKALGHYLGNVHGIAGATIMGDGRPALILEVSALMSGY